MKQASITSSGGKLYVLYMIVVPHLRQVFVKEVITQNFPHFRKGHF